MPARPASRARSSSFDAARTATVAALLLATALRTIGLAVPSVWFDEAWTAHAAALPTLAGAWLADATNPPLSYVLANVTARALGTGEFALRLPAALLGVVAAALAARLAGRMFGRWAGPVAALLVATSPLQVWAGREARMYTLMGVFSLIVVAGWLRVAGIDGLSAASHEGASEWRDGVAGARSAGRRRRARRGGWAMLVAAEVGALYSHNTGPVVVLALNALTGMGWIVQSGRIAARWRATQASPARGAGTAGTGGGGTGIGWRAWLASQAGVAAVWAPELWLRFSRLGETNDAVLARPTLAPALLGELWRAQWATPWRRETSPIESATVWVALAAVLILIPWRRREARYLTAYALLLCGGVVAGLLVLRNELHARYLVMAAAPLWVAAAGGVRAGRAELRAARALALVALAAASAVGLAGARRAGQGHEDARAMARHQARTFSAADTVIAVSYAERYDLAYYAPREGVTAQRLTLAEDVDAAAVWPRLPRAGRVALTMRYGSPADRRGMLPCLLGARAVAPPERFTTDGLSELRYVLDGGPSEALGGRPDVPVAPPPTRALDIAFELAPGDASAPIGRLVGLSAPARWPADRGLCVALSFQVDRPPPGELKATVRARNALGWDIASADAVFATADQRRAADVPPGTVLTAFALLRLPLGTPPGDVPLWVRVYDPVAAPDGYTPARVDGRASAEGGPERDDARDDIVAPGDVVGRDVALGRWTATAGAWDLARASLAAGTGADGEVHADGFDEADGSPGAADAVDLPRRLDVLAPGGTRLVATDAPLAATDAPALVNGGGARVTLLWLGAGPIPALTLADADGRWAVDVPPPAFPGAPTVRRDWRALRVPAEAPSGKAELRMPDGTAIGRWTVDSAPFVTAAPAVEVVMADGAGGTDGEIDFPGIGRLLGVAAAGGDGLSVAEAIARATPGAPLTVTLAWRAGSDLGAVGGDVGERPPPDLTVFVQLVDAAGRVAAQSDARPAGGSRPTSGWRPGEVIIDTHRLAWNDGPSVPPLTLITGLYDAASGVRARTAAGGDAVTLGQGTGGR